MLRYMLDTNICIYTIKNRPESVRQKFKRHQDELCISMITLMELLLGVEKSAQPQKNGPIVESFIGRVQVLDFDREAASQSAQLIAELARNGKPIGAYDSQIAGHARGQGLILVSNNQKEFIRVPGLRLENWV